MLDHGCSSKTQEKLENCRESKGMELLNMFQENHLRELIELMDKI